jgi:ABC-type Fe3+-citrate transport system substrate-binding protein
LSLLLDTISKLQGVSYNWKDTGKKDFGFIAEEVGKVLPDIVEWSQDPQYANSMDYTRIISFLVEAVKEQQKKIDLLAEKLDKLDV